MLVACVLYPRFTMLDIVGPFQVLSSLPDVQVEWVAETTGPVVDHTAMVSIPATTTFQDCADPDIVVVPGGMGTENLIPDHPSIGWLREVHASTQWTTSVCTGSLLLAAAGLLDGKAATSHWLMLDHLGTLGAEPTLERVVMHPDERLVTSAGVSSGIDMGLALVEQMYGTPMAETVQLAIEYDPQPCVDAGSPTKASSEIQDLVRLAFAAG